MGPKIEGLKSPERNEFSAMRAELTDVVVDVHGDLNALSSNSNLRKEKKRKTYGMLEKSQQPRRKVTLDIRLQIKE
jgi:hypothetical protein